MKIIPVNQELFQSGDDSVFREIVDTYTEPLFLFIRKEVEDVTDAEDIIAETFFELWKARGTITDGRHLKNFLFVAAMRNLIDFLKKRRHQPRHLSLDSYDPMPELIDPQIGADIQLLENEYTREVSYWLAKAISHLGEGNRYIVVFQLYHEGKQTNEIAELLGISADTVRKHKQIAIENIRAYVLKHGIRFILILLATLLLNF